MLPNIKFKKLNIRNILYRLFVFNICLLPLLAQATGDQVEHSWLYFVGLEEGQWKVFVRAESAEDFSVIETETEPRGIYLDGIRQQLYYMSAAGNLRKKDVVTGADSVLYVAAGQEGLSEPYVDRKTGMVYLSYMPEGKSSLSDIAVWDNAALKMVVEQISSQFEPFVHDSKWLYYGNVHCLLDCGRIIREVWRKNLVSGESDQITHDGFLSRQHVVNQAGDKLYYSSNKEGRFHIWRYSLLNKTSQQLTSGNVHDSSPVVDGQDNLFFIRQQKERDFLMLLHSDGELSSVQLPTTITDIRNLRLNF